MPEEKKVAVIGNNLVNAQYRLTTLEQKVVLYIATLVKPDSKDFETYTIPAIELAKSLHLKGTKQGAFYKRLDDILDSLMAKVIRFPSGVGSMKTRIVWFSFAEPKKIKNGQVVISFRFDPALKNFMLELKKNFTKYHFKEIVQLKSGYAIRLYQLLKSERDRQKKYVDVVNVTYSVDELREKLVVLDRLKRYKNFKSRVIKQAQNQLKTHTSIYFDFKEKKLGRKVIALTFSIYPNTPPKPPIEFNLFNQFTFEESQLDEVGKQVYEQVKDWHITPKKVMEMCQNKSKEYIFEMIEYTKKKHKEGRVKDPAAYFINAVKENYVDNEVAEKKAKEERLRLKREKAKKKKALGEQLKTLEKELTATKKPIYKKLIADDKELIPTLLEEVTSKNDFLKSRINIGLSSIENYHNSRMLSANIDSKIEEKYPKEFEQINKEYQTKKQALEQQIKALES